MFEQISTDPYILDIYHKINLYEDENKGIAHHDFQHVLNVTAMMEKLLTALGFATDFIEEAKIAGVLHDIGAIAGKEGHAYRGYLMASEYIEQNNFKLKNKEMILEAIKIHSAGFDTENIIALILIFSDKLDIKKSRLAKEGYKTIGMRQLQYIEDVVVTIADKNIDVNFVIDNAYNQNELNGFYFIKKVFKAINALATKLNKSYRITINDEIWNLY